MKLVPATAILKMEKMNLRLFCKIEFYIQPTRDSILHQYTYELFLPKHCIHQPLLHKYLNTNITNTDNTTAAMNESILNFERLLSEEIPHDEQCIMNLSRSMQEFPLTRSLSQEYTPKTSDSDSTSDTSDLSLASRLSLPPSDSSNIPDSASDTPKTEHLPASTIRPVMRVTSSRRRNRVMIKLSSESGQSDADDKAKSHCETSDVVEKIKDISIELDEKQDDEVFNTSIGVAKTSNPSGEMNANNAARNVVPLKNTWDATQRSLSCDYVTNRHVIIPRKLAKCVITMGSFLNDRYHNRVSFSGVRQEKLLPVSCLLPV